MLYSGHDTAKNKDYSSRPIIYDIRKRRDLNTKVFFSKRERERKKMKNYFSHLCLLELPLFVLSLTIPTTNLSLFAQVFCLTLTKNQFKIVLDIVKSYIDYEKVITFELIAGFKPRVNFIKEIKKKISV